MENEIETQEDITARLQKIEKQLANERVQSNELHKTLQSTYTMVDLLKNRLVNLVNKSHGPEFDLKFNTGCIFLGKATIGL